MVATESAARIGLLWQNEPGSTDPTARSPERFDPLISAFRELNVAAVPVLYSVDAIPAVRDRLLGVDGVIAWVNPVEGGVNRAPLDALLRDVASEGVWVSTHPDVILKMGTKEVLYTTRDLGWGSDTDIYRSVAEVRERFGARLRRQRVRVLKQGRGNGGNGVWKVDLLEDVSEPSERLTSDALVRVQHAVRRGEIEEITFGEFVERCEGYFSWAGFVVDQPFQERLAEGMIRCYVVQDHVAGFCHQWPSGLLPPSSGGADAPRQRSEMEGADAPAYQTIRKTMESEWIPQMTKALGLDTKSLPVIWDADFFYGAKTDSGKNTFVLCEINVSAVWPFPPQATGSLAAAAKSCALESSRQLS